MTYVLWTAFCGLQMPTEGRSDCANFAWSNRNLGRSTAFQAVLLKLQRRLQTPGSETQATAAVARLSRAVNLEL